MSGMLHSESSGRPTGPQPAIVPSFPIRPFQPDWNTGVPTPWNGYGGSDIFPDNPFDIWIHKEG